MVVLILSLCALYKEAFTAWSHDTGPCDSQLNKCSFYYVWEENVG